MKKLWAWEVFFLSQEQAKYRDKFRPFNCPVSQQVSPSIEQPENRILIHEL